MEVIDQIRNATPAYFHKLGCLQDKARFDLLCWVEEFELTEETYWTARTGRLEKWFGLGVKLGSNDIYEADPIPQRLQALGDRLYGPGWNSCLLYQYAAGMGLIATIRYRLKYSGNLDLSPSLHWAEPVVMIELRPDDGPVLITVEYRINPARSPKFSQAMHKLSCARRRDGAIRWGLFHDTADPSRYLETFVVESWAEHLRQHERVTVADRAIEEYARAFHISDTPPMVSHLIYAHETRGDYQV